MVLHSCLQLYPPSVFLSVKNLNEAVFTVRLESWVLADKDAFTQKMLPGASPLRQAGFLRLIPCLSASVRALVT